MEEAVSPSRLSIRETIEVLWTESITLWTIIHDKLRLPDVQVRGRSISNGRSRGMVSLKESPACILVLGFVLKINSRLVGIVVRLFVCPIFMLGKTEVLTENGDELTV